MRRCKKVLGTGSGGLVLALAGLASCGGQTGSPAGTGGTRPGVGGARTTGSGGGGGRAPDASSGGTIGSGGISSGGGAGAGSPGGGGGAGHLGAAGSGGAAGHLGAAGSGGAAGHLGAPGSGGAAGSPTARGGAGGGGGSSSAGAGGAAGCGGPALVAYTAWPFDATEAKKRQAAAAASLCLTPEVEVPLGGGFSITMVVIPQGQAALGSATTVAGWEPDETLHTVTFDKPFLIGKTMVTRGIYKGMTGAFPSPIGASLPMDESSLLSPGLDGYRNVQDVVRVMLQAYAPRGWTFRLPTNDEWEYAARSGAATVFDDGDTEADLARIAWYQANSGGKMHDVGLKLPNAWNVFDMMGNNWHWVFFPGDPGTAYADTDPFIHLVRGCDALSVPFDNSCRTSNRWVRNNNVAFRFVADVPVPGR